MLPRWVDRMRSSQFRHFGKQGRLVADGGRHAPEQAGQFAAGLHEAEHVVHQEQHLLAERIAQVLGVGQRRQADAKAHAGRFVHLPEHHQRVGHHAGILHVVPQLVAFADALADAGKHRNAAGAGARWHA